MSTSYNKLINNLEELKLNTIRKNLSKYIDMINNNEKTVVDALYELTQKEKDIRKERAIITCIKTAGFPFNKRIDDYDFSFQPSVNKKEMEDYISLRFLENNENILFIGYINLDTEAANLFFQLISMRYEHKSTIITTNKNLSKWGEIFSDSIIANAILDRLLHHSHIINIIGPSYRTKDILDALEE